MALKVPVLLGIMGGLAGYMLFRNSYLPSLTGRGESGGSFELIASNFSRQGYLWMVPFSKKRVELYVFLVQFGEDFVLVDTGAPGKEYSEFLIRGLHEAIGRGRLRLVVLTHGHIDHVGALPALKQTFTDAQVAYHAEEAPYLTGGALYKDIPSDHDQYSLITHDVSAALTDDTVLHIRGNNGDVADAYSPGGRKVRWLPPRGALKFQHVPGHAPGQVAYLHMPSGSLIAGDTFKTWLPPALELPPPTVTPNITQARLSAKALAALKYERAFCTHDSAMGVSRQDLQNWAAAL